MASVRTYYHLYTDSPRWEPILTRHLDALAESGVDWDLTIGIVGPEDTRIWKQVVDLIPEARPYWWPDGWEQRTLGLLHSDIHSGYDGPVLYAHSKGAAYEDYQTGPWRECMTRHLVRDAKACLDLLADGADTVGCHWLTPEDDDKVQAAGSGAYYGGNFWWASAGHLARLSAPLENTRFDAETWIASVRPDRPVSLVDGWPGYDCRKHLG